MNKCQRCKEDTDELRTLEMSCGYDMSELNLPFYTGDNALPVYLMDVCKSCRADWMSIIWIWFNSHTVKERCGSGIFIRHLGATIEVTEEEFKRLYPDKIPVRVKKCE